MTKAPRNSTINQPIANQPTPLQTCLANAYQYIQAAQWTAAEQVCREALALSPNHAEAHHLAGHVAGQLGDSDKSLWYLAQTIALDPQHPQYRYNYAVSLGAVGRENEAAIQYQACLRQDPKHRDALWNYGEMLRMAEHFDLAVQKFELFMQGGGNYNSLHHRLAVSYGALAQDLRAQAHFEHALKEVTPPDALTQWEYALFLLSREQFTQGFDFYHKRFQAGGRNSVFCHDFGYPWWQGAFKPNSTLLIHGEQGLGDEMMFASILPEVLAKAKASASRVILAVKSPVVRLFAHSFPDAVVVAHRVGGPVADLSGLGQIDWQLPIGDLAVLMRRQLADFEAGRRPYLRHDDARAQWYAQHLQALSGSHFGSDSGPLTNPHSGAGVKPKLRVGLMWGSNPAPVNAKFMRWSQQRSIPIQLFERLKSLVPRVQFVSLQNAERGFEAALAPALDILDVSHLQTDFLETASLIANVDLVISVDTSVSHLAGAMGKETWVPLIHRSDWRHGNKREKSYWYEQTRYFHQSQGGDWSPVLDAMLQAIEERLATQTHEIKTAELAQAMTLLGRRELDEALPYFEKALAESNNDARVQWEFAMQLLTQGTWGRGWDYHEARLAIFGAEALHMASLPWPMWRGEPLAGRTIVVHGEQGIGDEIMYMSMLPDLVAMQANVVLACVPSLVKLMQLSFPSITVVPHPRGAKEIANQVYPAWVVSDAVQKVDYQIPMGSLGQYLRRSAAAFPRQAYLAVEPERIIHMAQQLQCEVAKLGGVPPKPVSMRVGLAWCGSLGDKNARDRSMQLVQLQSLIALGQACGCQFVSLQSRQYAHQLQSLPNSQIVDMSEHTDDFSDLAALMCHMDLIISVDTSYAHLAGALGLPVWRMVIRTCDWRWGWGREDSVWYPKDRLFRQKTDGDWGAVVASVVSEFDKLSENFKSEAKHVPANP